MITLDSQWYGRICLIDPFQGAMLARYAVDTGYQNTAILQKIEFEYAVGLVNYFEAELAQHAVCAVVSKGNFVNAEQDFTTLLTDALSKNPDVIFTTFYDAAQPATHKTSQFLDAYRAKYNKEPAAPCIMAYDAYLTILAAIEAAAIRDALFATSGFEGAAGAITLNENHDAVRPVIFKQVAADGIGAIAGAVVGGLLLGFV